MIYKMTLKDSADEMTFDLLEVPIVDKDIEGAVDNVTLDGNQYTDYLWLKKQFIQKWSILCDDEYTRLRGFYTRQFENADVPSYRLYYGDDIIRNSTLSGERIELSISGVADGTMSLTQMDGNIEQTTYTGKNLLQAKMPTTTLNGITCTNNGDGSYTLNGTATAGADFRINQSTAHGEDNLQNYDGTYTLSCNELQNDMRLIVMQNQTWSVQLKMLGNNTPATATFTKNDCFIYVYVAQGKTLNNLRIHPMLEKSATATAYEPYVGGIPAPNPSYPQPIETVTGRQTVTVAGKNLFNKDDVVNGVVLVDGSISTAYGDNKTSNLIPVTPSTTYRVSGRTAWGVEGTYTQDKTWISRLSGDTFTTQADCYWVRITCPTADLNNIQLEQGSTATAYEPYNGQNYEINLGKNLFDKDNANVLDGYVSNSAIVAANDGYTIWIPCEPNATYTIQKMNASPQAKTRFRVATTQDEPILGRGIIPSTFWNPGDGSATNVHTITTASNSHYLVINIMNKTATTTLAQMLASIQIEKGYTASSFAPYFEPIELCKIGTYQDRIYKENGKWYLHKEIGRYDITGAEGWTRSGRTTSTVFAGVLANDALTAHMQIGANECFSNRFIYKGATVEAGGYDVYNYSSAGVVRAFVLYVSVDSASDITAFKTWLGTALPSVYYVLATATDTEITNEEVLEGLEALQDEAISVGQLNIYTDTPNALPTLTFDLTEYLSKSTTIIPETAVRLTLTDGGVINACGCRKDVQLTMRETIE